MNPQTIPLPNLPDFFPTLEVDGTYYFSSSFGLSVGLGFANFSDKISYNFPVSYDDGNTTATITGDVNAMRNFSYLEIPLTFHILDGYFDKVHFYIKPGLRFAFLVGVHNSEFGTISVQGYSEDINTTNNSTDNYSKFMLFGNIALGASIPLGKNVKLNIGADFRPGFLDLYTSSNQGTYQSIDGSTKSYQPYNPIAFGLEAALITKFGN